MKFREVTKREVNAGSMADIAFLLLIFFLVTTQIRSDVGLKLRLPPDETPHNTPVHERNLFKIQINSEDKVLVENETRDDLSGLQEELIGFINNYGKDPDSSVSPKDAVVSIKTDRGTTYDRYIKVLDIVQGAYYILRAEKAGITVEEFRALDPSEPGDFVLFTKGKEAYPMQISIAEPTDAGAKRQTLDARR